VTTPSGKRLGIAIQVQRRRNDSSASCLIRRMAAITYNQFENDTMSIPESAFAPKVRVSKHHPRHHIARSKHKVIHKLIASKSKKKKRRYA
jgi:hypothetical protein